MTPPPLHKVRTNDVSCVSATVRAKLESGKEVFAYYGYLTNSWWKDYEDGGKQLKQRVVSWKPVENN